ncbi:hypothetical protein LMG27952_05256 [Paraburkholderia hiiakae]|uniref:Uncharacterized protein n=1 Tax=Paraburkholderia hiiakae TaxID=1081782 RepID=A0ABM8P0G4_9BURK|nr:hypothetical protein [Paraburkholderia hiiakae]CAD6552224.1 hypothetical protein LMG27952_05256 [Paraburkholderia hiiakae]
MCAVCEFKIEFGISHPLALSVAVATRKAIEANLIEAIDVDDGALAAARKRMAAVEALNLLQARIEGTHSEERLLDLPDFFVLLIENDTWGFFHATTEGFDPDIVPEIPDVTTTEEAKRSNIVVMSESALRGWLAGRFDVEHALHEALFVVDGPQNHADALTQMFYATELASVAH